MKSRHISAHEQRFFVLMHVINRLDLLPAWLILTHQNSKRLLMSRYTTVTHILFSYESLVSTLYQITRKQTQYLKKGDTIYT